MTLPQGAYTPEEAAADMSARPALEERVAAIEAAMWPLQVSTPAEWTPDQVADFEDRLRQEMGDGAWKRHQIRLLPPAPVLAPETARALLSECVTVVRPGETLVIRAPETWTPQDAEDYQRHADATTESGRISFPVLVVIGDELAVAKPQASQAGRVLSGADPEPPVGTLVRDACGDQWTRSDEGDYWLCGERTDPETWVKIAGNYGPVTVLEWGETG